MQVARAGCNLLDSNCQSNTNVAAEVCKVPIKRTSGLTVTVNTLSDPDFPDPLTPNHLLTLKTKVVLPPPGMFQSADLYSRKRWRRVQHLANEFWCHWRKEYLASLQQRSKWNNARKNLAVGDIVMVKDDSLPRNCWQLARVSQANISNDGHVRTVKVKVGDPSLSAKGKRN